MVEFLGRGFGNSDEKLFYLPEAHNDFIFSVLGEELGFIGVVVFVLVLMAFIYNGLKLSFSKNDNVIKSLLIAVVFLIGFQSFLNIGVVLGLLPTKGLNLPFVSFRGSSLVCNFWYRLNYLRLPRHEFKCLKSRWCKSLN